MNTISIEEPVDLKGQVALVTGGSRGLGRAFALALANSGAIVAVTARSEDQLEETVALIEESGGRALAFPADVTDRRAIDALVSEIEQRLGPVDLLMNNAGRWKLIGELWELDPEAWWREVEVNLRGPFLCARAVLPKMIERRYGRIINLASGAGLSTGTYGSAYQISKTALIRFSENLAAETKDYGIRVFAITPGTVRTSMTRYWVEEGVAALPEPMRQRFEWIQTFFEDGHGTPIEQSVQLVLWLASGRADVLTGRFISVDDNLTEMIARADEIQRDHLYTLRLNT
jgi:NAD(P)-dependent dehydrogenase (short-subunit alcohol dehydrogenase family)